MPLSGARCLVIGGRGFVGSALAAHARERGMDVRAVGRADYASSVGERFDLVVFAAGNARRYLADRDPASDLDASVGAVYRALRDFSYDVFVLASTVDVYVDPSRPEATREDAPIDPARLSTYGFHKRMAELVVMRSAARFLIVRLGQMVGPGLVKGPVHDVLCGEPLRVALSSRYPLLRTRSAAAITFALLEAGVSRDVVNVCARGDVSLARIVELLGRSAVAPPGVPEERYAVDVSAACRAFDVPTAEEEARAFASSIRC
ncbi:MAG TPA: NAD(P)-dependent oxidoreductase [Sandaracinaceae bacterium]